MGCPVVDLGERFHLDARDRAGEGGEELTSVKVVACQL